MLMTWPRQLLTHHPWREVCNYQPQAADINACLVSLNTRKLVLFQSLRQHVWRLFAGVNVVLIGGGLPLFGCRAHKPYFVPWTTQWFDAFLPLVWNKKAICAQANNATNPSWLTPRFTVALNDVCYSVAAEFLSVWSQIGFHRGMGQWTMALKSCALLPDHKSSLNTEQTTKLLSIPTLSVWFFLAVSWSQCRGVLKLQLI